MFPETTLRLLHNPEMKYVAAFGVCRGLLEALCYESEDIPENVKEYIRQRLNALKKEME